jgi:hypothetical protein
MLVSFSYVYLCFRSLFYCWDDTLNANKMNQTKVLYCMNPMSFHCLTLHVINFPHLLSTMCTHSCLICDLVEEVQWENQVQDEDAT